ncbi:MAG TPA: hypothetical protein VF323_00745, partial [Candidatus Limnocylindrales bacterium]
VLASPDLVAKLGVDELKDALVTLHPQSAMEHLHHRFVAADGTGSDGALAVEATEVSSTARQRALVPVRPPEPLAGTPDRSPIPLADSVGDGVAAVSAGAGRARSAAGGVVGRGFRRLQDLLPARSRTPRRVNPATSRARTQRRAAMAAFVLVIVVTALGLLVVYFPGDHGPVSRPSQVLAADAVQTIRDDLAKISGPGFDLIHDDRPKALALLSDAFAKVQTARASGVQETVLAPLRAQVQRGLETYFSVVPVATTNTFVFPVAKTTPDLIALVRGPVDGLPYVLDRGSKAVYRIDPRTKTATVVLRAGLAVAAGTPAEPRFLAVGGRDVLILDARNTLWRWRPADLKGRGTLVKVRVTGSASWGSDVRGIATYQPGGSSSGLYRLYVIRPGLQQVEMYTAAPDGSGYPGSPSKRLPGPQKLDDVDAMLIDGDIYFAQAGKVSLVIGRSNWKMATIGDDVLHPATDFTAIATSSHSVGAGAALRILDDDLGSGTLYAYDRTAGRIVAFAKDSGGYQVQYRLANGDATWGGLRSFYLVPGAGTAPPSVVWIGQGNVGIAALVAVPDTITGTVAPSPSPSASPSGNPKPTVKPKPKVTPRPTKKP